MGFGRGLCLVFPATELVMLWQAKMELNTPLELEVHILSRQTNKKRQLFLQIFGVSPYNQVIMS